MRNGMLGGRNRGKKSRIWVEFCIWKAPLYDLVGGGGGLRFGGNFEVNFGKAE
jgi:hypothetical protein